VNAEIKARWVAALRSGEYDQGTGQLRGYGRFCCWGVLCDLARSEGIGTWNSDGFDTAGGVFFSWPPDSVCKWAGVDVMKVMNPVPIADNLLPLSKHNDTGRTFAEIADAIEAQL
jgi:hypothetical protein